MNIKAWITAFRLRTLPLALASIGMASFIAWGDGVFNTSIFVMAALTTILLQILSNLANDYGDSIHGADHSEREGPARMVQSGAISLRDIRIALYLFIGLCLFSGCTLLWFSFGWEWRSFFFFLLLGVMSILAAIAYTAGRKPYGYAGLGDLSVIIFFGLVGVLGTYYLYNASLYKGLTLPALSCGLFSAGVLNVNNIRDIESDRRAGKLSIPVRIGRKRAVLYHYFLIAGGLLLTIVFTLLYFHSGWQFLFLLAFPLFIVNLRAVSKYKTAIQLDPYLKQLALTTLLFVVLFGIGYCV